ncbi:class I SAM-dependent methyltransferase [Streptomyces himalayensis]|uniref:Class I SAM-dependent methyltransferase n=1 Tax=Streptomyces himalayensis subsp. himalayensis TaxID=2756131 RepID=A0A7W0DPN2_9ACTN|nr:class I SAM-dependent methyltransferase [Streptomyces himalayensis]MBA2948968.1 class I SAM-dependent methyltransferase [Streptomyces himalayensis subsp. himalayensis]
MKSRSLLRSSASRRLLRPLADLIDQRIERQVRSAVRREQSASESVQRDVQVLRQHQVTFDLLVGPRATGISRVVVPSALNRLQSEVAALGGDRDAAVRNVAAAFRLLVALESLGVGRIAGGTMNICGKLGTIPLLDPPNDEILEIGTLYGMFSAGLVRMMERNGRSPSLTIVDPFAGVQLQPGTDQRTDPTGTPVDEHAVRTNLALAGPAGAAARIHQGFSEDPETRAAVSDRRYGVIIVDGDHSAEGVAKDLEWAEEIAAPGGIVVLDDYSDPKWPGIKEALDKHLAGDTRFTYLGRAARSAFLRAS